MSDEFSYPDVERRRNQLVSVIIPVFNGEEFIAQAIQSAIAQTYQNLEIIVIDDGSEDRTYEAVCKLAGSDDRIKHFQLPKNSRNPAVPRNKGLEIAHGDYIAFLDSDDIWFKDKLEVQMSAIESLGLDFVSSKAKKAPESFLYAETYSDKTANSDWENVSFSKLLKKNIIVTSSVLCSRRIIGEHRFSELDKHTGVEDYLMWLNLHRNQSIKSAVLMDKLVCYRVRDGSMSRSKFRMAMQVLALLSEIEVDGKTLGIKKWVYFANYFVRGLRDKAYS